MKSRVNPIVREIKRRVGQFGRVVSIDPRSQRVAWAYFQDGKLQDCSVRTCRHGRSVARVNQSVIPYLIELLERVSPHAIVVPRIRGGGVRSRGRDSARAIRGIVREAVERGIAVHVISPESVDLSFSHLRGEVVRNKEDIHREILDRFPELTAIVPRPRAKMWDPEPYFTPLFNAVAMYVALAHRLSQTPDA